MNSWIQTFSGEKVDPLNPQPENIHLIDVAHSLSQQCRFTGHTTKFYSVARHSINCAKLMRAVTGDPVFLKSALLHDAGEAYLSDIARPVKHSGGMDEYCKIEKNIENAVCRRFGTIFPHNKDLKWVDNVMLRAEAEKLLMRGPLDNWHLTLPTCETFNVFLPNNWFESDPAKDCKEFLDLYGQYQY